MFLGLYVRVCVCVCVYLSVIASWKSLTPCLINRLHEFQQVYIPGAFGES